MLKSSGVGAKRVGGGQSQLVEYLLGGPHGVDGERGDATGKPGDEIIQFGVG